LSKIAETPLMLQYMEMKKKHPDAILLFRVGDFYETFSDDAIVASEILGITLTRRANGSAKYVELAGFPHHALDTYLPKLVRAGKRVAICEQLEDPKLTKKLVKRGITELVTPGVNTNDNSLPSKSNNFLAAIHVGKKAIGVAFLDITTGEFICSAGCAADVDKLLAKFNPSELLRMRGTRQYYESNFSHKCSVYELDDWVYTLQAAEGRLTKQFATSGLKGFGISDLPDAVIAAGSILHYLDLTQHTNLGHITTLSRLDEDRYVRLDRFTIRNLELIDPLTPEGTSLRMVLDNTLTAMGSRLLANWLLFPSTVVEEIKSRHDAVEAMLKSPDIRERVAEALKRVGDLRRLVGKISNRRAGPRELLQLATAIESCASLKDMLISTGQPSLRRYADMIDPLSELLQSLTSTLNPDAPVKLDDGNVILPGVSPELDRLRDISAHGKEALDEIVRRESAATGITSLKISYNNVFGYYIEVRNAHKDKVPESWVRRQTLVNAERYITPELKDYEEKILGASERIRVIEGEIFESLLRNAMFRLGEITRNASASASVDCILAFAVDAEQYRYVRPVIDDSLDINITDGRHPVIERCLPPGEPYIANDVQLDSDSRQIMMITGPNMSGKSALLRQTALITLMAQTGSFVPASAARIGIVDKIFTRVGASDNISSGESTFMVEMNEAASILNNMSQRSLILFDELGRGTSTYDGISIAWSIVEYIHENGRCRPKTLFATHYHELNEMEKTFSRISNYNVAVKDLGGKVVFLRKLERGGSEHSFGIHVAKLAGMPPSIVKRASEVLRRLEEGASRSDSAADLVSKDKIGEIAAGREGYQMSFFQLDDPLLTQIRDQLVNLDINNLTPIQALTTLHELQGLVTGKQ